MCFCAGCCPWQRWSCAYVQKLPLTEVIMWLHEGRLSKLRPLAEVIMWLCEACCRWQRCSCAGVQGTTPGRGDHVLMFRVLPLAEMIMCWCAGYCLWQRWSCAGVQGTASGRGDHVRRVPVHLHAGGAHPPLHPSSSAQDNSGNQLIN